VIIKAPSEESRGRHPSLVISENAQFAHPSERVFASILSLYGHDWVYEPIEFPLAWNSVGQPTRGFRPDFFLPDRHLFIEMTVLDQRLVTKKNQKIRQFRELYPEVDLVVVYQRDFNDLIQRHGLHVIAPHAA
jgi:hypoxanthine phosphoribosyltransferase